MSKLPRLSMTLITRVFILALGLSLFFEQAGARQLLHLDGSADVAMMTPAHWASLLAPGFYLWALWAASGILGSTERGQAFGPPVINGLRQTGAGLMLGTVASIMIQPSLVFLIGNGFTEMRGVRFNYTVENLTLILVGLMLLLLARQGQAMKSNLDGFV